MYDRAFWGSVSWSVLPCSGLPIRLRFPRSRVRLPSVRSGSPVLAFNGKDLTGFYTYLHDHKYNDPDHVFTVSDGMLRISGQEWGGLTTRDEFADYHLIVEWKWGEKTWPPRLDKARDSGILLHCVGPDGAAAGQWMESQECQIIEGGCGDLSWSAAAASRA